MIFLEKNGDLPDPAEAVFRGIESRPLRLVDIFLRFAFLVLLFFGVVTQIPDFARLFLDPVASFGAWLGPQANTWSWSQLWQRLVWAPLLLLGLAALLDRFQSWIQYKGRRVAFRKQAWSLYAEFRSTIQAELGEDEAALSIRMADSPELASSLLFRVGFLTLTLLWALGVLAGALALRVHWPQRGQELWYLSLLPMTLAGILVLAKTRTPPMLRLFLQSAMPTLHFGHGLMLATTPVPWLGLPAYLVDIALGIASGMAGYRLGQRERGGGLLVFTNRRVLRFDPAGRQTRLLAQIRPAAPLRIRANLAGSVLDFGPKAPRLFRDLGFESQDSAQEVAEFLTQRFELSPPEVDPRAPGWRDTLATPKALGWALLLGLAVGSSATLTEVLDVQLELAHRLLPPLPAFAKGDPRGLAESVDQALSVRGDLVPAHVFGALAKAHLGRWKEARGHLEALGLADRSRGFAARTLPELGRFLDALEKTSTTPGDDRVTERARFLLTQTQGPDYARVGLEHLLADRGRSPSQESLFLEWLGRRRLVDFPEAFLPWGRTQDRLQTLRQLSQLSTRLEAGPPKRFAEISLFLLQEEIRPALERALEGSQWTSLGRSQGLRLLRQVLLRALEKVQSDPKLSTRIQAWAEGLTPPPASEISRLVAALYPPEKARERLGPLQDPPPPSSLGQILASEAAARYSWSEYHAVRLLGPAAIDPETTARMFPPLSRAATEYIRGLALRGFGRPEANSVLSQATQAKDFPFPIWWASRSLSQSPLQSPGPRGTSDP